jgi:hypothetical protein
MKTALLVGLFTLVLAIPAFAALDDRQINEPFKLYLGPSTFTQAPNMGKGGSASVSLYLGRSLFAPAPQADPGSGK